MDLCPQGLLTKFEYILSCWHLGCAISVHMMGAGDIRKATTILQKAQGGLYNKVLPDLKCTVTLGLSRVSCAFYLFLLHVHRKKEWVEIE